MRRLLVGIGLLVALAAVLVKLAEYDLGPVVITREDESKLVLLLQEPRAQHTEAGISFRLGIPVVEEVLTFDARWLHLSSQPLPIQTIDRERIVVDNYVMWRIQDPLAFYESYRGNQGKAEQQIAREVGAAVREVIGQHRMPEVLKTKREEITDMITARSATALARFGIAVKDVRINRTELPAGAEENVYARMRAERERLARKHRAEGEEEARGIRADADRDARVTIANASEAADLLRGAGDADSARIYADAFGQDVDFFVFLRSLEAYRKTLGEGTTMVLPPSHEFFRLFQTGGSDMPLPAVSAPTPPPVVPAPPPVPSPAPSEVLPEPAGP